MILFPNDSTRQPTRLAIIIPLLYFITTLFCETSSLELTLLHTNDIHTRFEQTDQYAGECTTELEAAGECYGGVARRMTKIKEIRNSGNNVLLLDAGDAYQGTIWFYVYRGMATAHFMNRLQYNAMALGNHEFDIDIDGLTPFLENITFPAMSCNIDSSKEPSMQGLYVCSHVVTLPEGDEIGIVGYTLESTPDYAKTGELIFNSELGGDLQQGVHDLIDRGINKIIALGHSGIEMDKAVATTIKGVDVVIGGHTNTFLYSGNPPSNEEPYGEYPLVLSHEGDEASTVLVVSAYAYGKYLGRLDITFDEAGVVTEYSGNPILLDNKVEQDQDTLNDLLEWKTAVDKVADEIVGQTFARLEGDYPICGTQECNMGIFLADAMIFNQLSLPNGQGWSDVSIAMTTTGSIRASIDSGPITIEQLTRVMPYGNTIDKVQLTGEHLLQVLEISVETYQEGSPTGTLLQVSGLLIGFDVTRAPGDRVLSVVVKCSDCDVPIYEPLDLDKVYTILMNSYQAGGGGGYSLIKENKLSHVYGLLDVDVTINYLRGVSSIMTGVEGRQTIFTTSNPPPCYTGEATSLRPAASLIILSLCCALLNCLSLSKSLNTD